MTCARLLPFMLGALLACACRTVSEGATEDARAKNGPAEDDTAIRVECHVELGLTATSGLRSDWMDRERGWTVSVNGDSVTLMRRGSCGDECGFVEEVVLADTPDNCPTVVSARTVKREAMSPQGPAEEETRAEQGLLQMQDWDLDAGVVSGRLTAEVEFTFYATFQR